jgi:hypothetical protein
VALVQLGVVIPALVGTVDGDILLELLPLEKDDRVIWVTVSVEASEEVTSLIVTLIGKQPTRRLGEEPNAEYDNTGGNALESEGETPRQVRGDLLCAKRDTGGGDRASEPTVGGISGTCNRTPGEIPTYPQL